MAVSPRHNEGVEQRVTPGSLLSCATHPVECLHLRRGASASFECQAPEEWEQELRTQGGPAYGLATGSESGTLRIDLTGSISFYAHRQNPTVTAYAPAEVGNREVLSQFLHVACIALLPMYGWECLHASAVAAQGRAIAFCGDRETGKSSLAAAALSCGADPYGDDALVFSFLPTGEVRATRLPQEIKPREPARSAFPRSVGLPLADFAPGESSWTLHLQRDALPLSEIYTLGPRYDDPALPPWVIENQSPSDALKALLTEAHCVTLRDPQRKRQMADRFLSLVEATPIYRLRMRNDLAVLPLLTDHLLNRPSSVPSGAIL